MKGNNSAKMKSEERKQRAELRERYIRFLLKLTQKEVEIQLHDRTYVRGKFIAFKANNAHFAVDLLQTPIGVINHAVIRSSDTIAMTADAKVLVENTQE